MHSTSLFGRPIPRPGSLPQVKFTEVPAKSLEELIPGKEYAPFGYVQQAEWVRPSALIRWQRELQSQVFPDKTDAV